MDDISSSARLLNEVGIPYKFIVATCYQDVRERVQFLADELRRGHFAGLIGFVVYSQECDEPRTISNDDAKELMYELLIHPVH